MNNTETINTLLGAWQLPTKLKTFKKLDGKFIKTTDYIADIEINCVYRLKNKWLKHHYELVSVKISYQGNLIDTLNFSEPPVSEDDISWFDDLSSTKITRHNFEYISVLKEKAL